MNWGIGVDDMSSIYGGAWVKGDEGYCSSLYEYLLLSTMGDFPFYCQGWIHWLCRASDENISCFCGRYRCVYWNSNCPGFGCYLPVIRTSTIR